ncbi:hypothetical protein Tco_1009093 [Tanacetum coccineum]
MDYMMVIRSLYKFNLFIVDANYWTNSILNSRFNRINKLYRIQTTPRGRSLVSIAVYYEVTPHLVFRCAALDVHLLGWGPSQKIGSLWVKTLIKPFMLESLLGMKNRYDVVLMVAEWLNMLFLLGVSSERTGSPTATLPPTDHLIGDKNVQIGNGLLEDVNDTIGIIDFVWINSLVSDETRQEYLKACSGGGFYQTYECTLALHKTRAELG